MTETPANSGARRGPATQRRSFASGTFLYLLFVVLLTTLAFGLRIYRLDHQSLWYDEGFSIWLADKDLSAITTGDFNPPLYVYLLHFWVGWAGQTEFAARFLSLLFSVLAVPLTVALGARLFDRAAGLLGGLLIAVAPFHLWYAQEVRMYAMVTALSLLGCLALVKALRGHRPAWLLYVLATVAAVYTHYYAWMVVAAQTLFVLWWLLHTWGRRAWQRAQVLGAVAGRQTWPDPPRSFLFWLISQIALILAVIPWLPIVLEHYRQQNMTYWPGTLSVQWVAERAFTAFSVGETLEGDLARWATLGFLALVLIGVVGTLIRNRRRLDSVIFGMLYTAVPIILLYLIVRDQPKFAARYLMVATPGFYLLAGAGLRSLWPRRGDSRVWMPLGVLLSVGATTFLLGTSSKAASNMYFDPTYAREDFRGLAHYLEDNVGEDEGVLLLSGHFFPVFQYYYHRDNVMPIPADAGPAPAIDEPITLSIAEELDRFAVNRDGLWVVLWQDEVVDPNGVLMALLDRIAEPVSVKGKFHGLQLRHYRLPPDALFAVDIEHPLGVTPIPQVRLVGYDLLNDPTPADTPIDLLLYWQALDDMNANYRVSLRLVDSQGMQWAIRDGQLAGFWYPTYRWSTGEVILGRHQIPLAAGTPPGEYALNMVFYAAEDPMQATEVSLGSIIVTRPAQPPTVDELDIPYPVTAFFGGLELMGYDISSYRTTPGANLELTLFWRAHQGPGIGRQFQLRLGEFVLPLDVSFPVEAWQAGDVFKTRHRVRVPADDQGGIVPLQIEVLDPDGETVASPARLADITVAVANRLFDVPRDIEHPERVELGSSVTFLGYDIGPRNLNPGDKVELTLYWQATESMTESYKVFTHLMNVGIGMWGQVDAFPVSGTRPTTGWLAGEVIVDRYEIPIDPSAPAGEYYVEVGLYDPDTLERLPAVAGGQRLPDDRIIIEDIRVEP